MCVSIISVKVNINDIRLLSDLSILAYYLIHVRQGATMKVAIPEHQGRVAPVFDCCRRMLIFVQDSNSEELVADQDWSMLSAYGRVGRLKELAVELLVCGGISCWMEEQIHRNRIRLIPWISGGIVDVLAALREGRLSDACYMMPGRGWCKRKGQRNRVKARISPKPDLFQKGV